MLTLRFTGTARDPAIGASGTPARPPIGEYVAVSCVVENSGGTQGTYSVTGQMVAAGTSTHEGYLWPTSAAGSPGATPAPTTGTVAAGASSPVTLYTAGIASQASFAGVTMLDVQITLTDTTGGGNVPTVYLIANAIAIPAAPEVLTLSSVSLTVGG